MRLSFPSTVALAASLAACGEAAPGGPLDAAAPSDAPAFDVGAAADAPAAVPCARGGSGRLRVSVALSPALEPRAPEVWLAARCGVDDREVRLVRWDRSAAMLLDGLGPGRYEVFASSFLAPPAASARAELNAFATASLSVTLPADPEAIASISAGGAGVAVDAGVATRGDASAAGADAAVADAAVAAWSGRAYVRDATGASVVGAIEVEVAAAPSTDEAPRVTVRVVARNTCASNACPTITLAGAEVRALDGETPVGIGAGLFAQPRLAAGESTSLRAAIELRGAVPDARRAIRLAIYGAVESPATGARRP